MAVARHVRGVTLGLVANGQDDTLASSLPASTAVTADLPAVLAERYEIVRWLGGGGMGRVYEVLDRELGEQVALKVLRAGLSDDALERFRREVRLTRKIQHRNVARMFDIGEHAGHRFLTMELIGGAQLTLELGAPMPWGRIRHLALQLAAGLGAAHHMGVVHRDLKPDNILVERTTDRVVITDFGIARGGDDAAVTHVGTVIGTPRYMAPEQLAGWPVDPRADLFSLGVILFEMATGARPWSGDNAIHLAVAQATTPPRGFEGAALPREIEELIVRCLRLERERRPATAEEIAAVIAACDATPAPRAPRPTLAPPRSPIVTHSGAGATVMEGTSLAVLPLGCGPADDYLADGLREDLIDVLSMTPHLRVRPAGLGRAQAEADAREIGRQLEVEHVIAGSVRRTPAGLRVATRLIGVADGFQIWAQRVDCTEADLLAVSQDLAERIAQALSTRAASSARPMDPRAVDLYLRARAELRRFWGEHAQNATDLLEQALAYAPSAPQLLGAHALAAVQTWIRQGGAPQLATAVASVERGLASGLGEAHLAAANLQLNQGALELAARNFGVAVARAPMFAQAHEGAGRLLVEIGALDEGRRHFETAIGLDPGRAQLLNMDLARLDALDRNWVAVDRRLAQLVTDPDPPVVRLGLVMQARLAMWRRDLESTMAAVRLLTPQTVTDAGSLIAIYQRWRTSGQFDAAAWDGLVVPLLDRQVPQRFQVVMLQRLAELAVLMDQPDHAVQAMHASFDMGLIDLHWADSCPLLVDLGAHPGLAAMRARVAERAARLLAAYRAA